MEATFATEQDKKKFSRLKFKTRVMSALEKAQPNSYTEREIKKMRAILIPHLERCRLAQASPK